MLLWTGFRPHGWLGGWGGGGQTISPGPPIGWLVALMGGQGQMQEICFVSSDFRSFLDISQSLASDLALVGCMSMFPFFCFDLVFFSLEWVTT